MGQMQCLCLSITVNCKNAEQDFYWKEYINGDIPEDALKGPNGKYIGQITHKRQVLPASIDPHRKIAIAERAGKLIVTDNIKILCTSVPNKFYWEYINFNLDNVTDYHMRNAFKGGHQDGYSLYIGKALDAGEWKIGKVVPKSNWRYKGLQVWNQSDQCNIIRNFQILKYASEPNPIRFSNSEVCGLPDDTYLGGVMQKFYWKEYIRGEIPLDAFSGTHGKYIGQVTYDGQILPACIYPQKKTAIAIRAGKRVITHRIMIMCTPVPDQFYWEYIDFTDVNDQHLKNAVRAGYEDGYYLFIGKALRESEWKIGKVVLKGNSSCKGLQIWNHHGRCAFTFKFLILKYTNDPNSVQPSRFDELPDDESSYESPCCTSEEFTWKNYVPGDIPEDAVQSPENKYIGQINYNSHTRLPVCIFSDSHTAIGEYYGKRVFTENIKILCTINLNQFVWQPIDFSSVTDSQMKDAVVGGYQEGYELYIGKAHHEGEWKIGKVVPKEHFYKGLQVWNRDNGCDIILNFHILKYISYSDI